MWIEIIIFLKIYIFSCRDYLTSRQTRRNFTKLTLVNNPPSNT